MCAVVSVLEHSGNTKVSNFNRSILVHKDVLSLQISVQDFSVVDMFNSQRHLHEPIEDLVFTVTHFANLFLVGNLRVQVSSVCIVHDDAEAPLIHEALFVGNNVRVPHGLQHMHFIDCIFSLLAVHLRNIDDLHDVSLSVVDCLHKHGEPKRALSDNLEFPILFHIQINCLKKLNVFK